MSATHNVMSEWSEIHIGGAGFTDPRNRLLAQRLTDDGIAQILELPEGIRIKSNSYVGSVNLGDFSLQIVPKLDKLPLSLLLRYTYGIQDLKLYGNSLYFTGSNDFFDLLIYALYTHVDDLLRKGFFKGYIPREEELSCVKGRINMRRVAGCGGILAAALPCRYYQREENTLLNRVLLSGLQLAQDMATEVRLKHNIGRMAKLLSGFINEIPLDRHILALADRSVNRLTENYQPIIEIIGILYDARATQKDDARHEVLLPGYFFDMNRFFEKLVSKLLEALPEDYSVTEQYRLKSMFSYDAKYNPQKRRSPTPRPDFVLSRNGRKRIIDAKYRDLWNNNLPHDMLYQLAVYALSSVGGKEATILYPALSDTPELQVINVYNPIQGELMARIKLQPLNLNTVADMVSGNAQGELRRCIHSAVGYTDM